MNSCSTRTSDREAPLFGGLFPYDTQKQAEANARRADSLRRYYSNLTPEADAPRRAKISATAAKKRKKKEAAAVAQYMIFLLKAANELTQYYAYRDEAAKPKFFEYGEEILGYIPPAYREE